MFFLHHYTGWMDVCLCMYSGILRYQHSFGTGSMESGDLCLGNVRKKVIFGLYGFCMLGKYSFGTSAAPWSLTSYLCLLNERITKQC